MKRTILILTMLLALTFVTLPTDSYASGEQPGKNKSYGKSGSWQKDSRRGRRRHQGRNKTYYGYKNYGQYRRTQVGNRRYRLVRRSYWRDGVRLSRLVRLYY